jgi:hypothetical protein
LATLTSEKIDFEGVGLTNLNLLVCCLDIFRSDLYINGDS